MELKDGSSSEGAAVGGFTPEEEALFQRTWHRSELNHDRIITRGQVLRTLCFSNTLFGKTGPEYMEQAGLNAEETRILSDAVRRVAEGGKEQSTPR